MRKCRSRAVSRILSAFASPSPCGVEAELRRDDHSSSPVITGGVKRPTRRLASASSGERAVPGGGGRTGRPRTPPYLVLLRAGFCLPPVLPRARCALTAPFHPYLTCAGPDSSGAPSRLGENPALRKGVGRACRDAAHSAGPGPTQVRRYIFCATFLRVALTGDYPAHCPAEFGLSSPRGGSGRTRPASSGESSGAAAAIRLPPA